MSDNDNNEPAMEARGVGHSLNDTHDVLADAPSSALQVLIEEIEAKNRMRNRLVKANTKLILQQEAIKRLKDIPKEEMYLLKMFVTAPLIAAQKPILEQKKKLEKMLEDLAKELPIYSWWIEGRGRGALGLAQIVGEAGDIGSYRSVGGLWKRFGLHVVNGQSPVPKRGVKSEYSPHRRAVMFLIGDSLVKAKEKPATKPNPYREIYDDRKAKEIARNESGEHAERAAAELKKKTYQKNTAAFKAFNAGKLPAMMIHLRAQRYMEKRLLRDLYNEWRK